MTCTAAPSQRRAGSPRSASPELARVYLEWRGGVLEPLLQDIGQRVEEYQKHDQVGDVQEDLRGQAPTLAVLELARHRHQHQRRNEKVQQRHPQPDIEPVVSFPLLLLLVVLAPLGVVAGVEVHLVGDHQPGHAAEGVHKVH